MKLPLSKYVWFDGKYVLTEKASKFQLQRMLFITEHQFLKELGILEWKKSSCV